MEFRGKPWREVLDWLSQQAGLSVVGNVRPTGAFTFIPTRPDYSIAEVFDILNEALIQQRFLLIRRQATFTLVPADEPIDPLLVPRVRADELKDRGQTEMVSVAYALKTLRADDTIAKEIKRLMGPFGEVIPQPTSKLLILRDTAGNLRRIIETLELAEKGAAAPGPADKPEKRLKFEVRDKSWPAVLQWFSQETGLPRIGSSVTGTFTITPPPKPEGYTIPEVIDILNEALMQQKYILIRRAASYTIAPADEPIDPWLLPRVAADELKDRGKTELVNLGYRLKTVNAGEMVSEVKKMLGPLGQVVPLERRNELALMDTVGNLRRIVEALDGVEKKQAEKRIRFEFRDRAGALNWLSQQTGLPLITTNMPTSTVGFVPPVKPEGYTIPEVIDLLNEGLLLQKYVLIRCEASLTILPVDEKIDPSIPPRITLDDLKDRGKTELVSVVLPLKSMTAKDAAPEIKRMMGALGEITVLSNNQLVVQDTVGNLRRVVAALDAVEKDKKDPAAPDR
jgi:type II secretory pathway component GspD/PulD (secretin)